LGDGRALVNDRVDALGDREFDARLKRAEAFFFAAAESPQNRAYRREWCYRYFITIGRRIERMTTPNTHQMCSPNLSMRLPN
jgi:hypothetical protein